MYLSFKVGLRSNSESSWRDSQVIPVKSWPVKLVYEASVFEDPLDNIG